MQYLSENIILVLICIALFLIMLKVKSGKKCNILCNFLGEKDKLGNVERMGCLQNTVIESYNLRALEIMYQRRNSFSSISEYPTPASSCGIEVEILVACRVVYWVNMEIHQLTSFGGSYLMMSVIPGEDFFSG